MLVSELKERLKDLDDDKMVIISDGEGWCNIDAVVVTDEAPNVRDLVVACFIVTLRSLMLGEYLTCRRVENGASVVHRDEVETPQRLRLHRAASGASMLQDMKTRQIIKAQSILSQPDTKHDRAISTQAMCIPSAMIRCQ